MITYGLNQLFGFNSLYTVVKTIEQKAEIALSGFALKKAISLLHNRYKLRANERPKNMRKVEFIRDKNHINYLRV